MTGRRAGIPDFALKTHGLRKAKHEDQQLSHLGSGLLNLCYVIFKVNGAVMRRPRVGTLSWHGEKVWQFRDCTIDLEGATAVINMLDVMEKVSWYLILRSCQF